MKERASKKLKVVPAAFPAPKLMVLLANIVGMLQGLLIILVLMNDRLPESIRENKMMVVFGLFLVGSMVSSALTNTNAFEIFVGDELVFSKLQKDRMPNLRDLVEGFQSVGVRIST